VDVVETKIPVWNNTKLASVIDKQNGKGCGLVAAIGVTSRIIDLILLTKRRGSCIKKTCWIERTFFFIIFF
jgi:hypothetical protein